VLVVVVGVDAEDVLLVDEDVGDVTDGDGEEASAVFGLVAPVDAV